MERIIRIGVYRILRRLGADRNEILPQSELSHLIEFDQTEWTCFMFFIESKFDISILLKEERQLVSVEDTMNLVHQKLEAAKQTFDIEHKQIAVA